MVMEYQPAPFSPRALGLPHEEYREPYQWDAVLKALTSTHKFVGLCLATGSGKSLCALSLAQLLKNNGRVALLTSTKAHQDQLQAEFGQVEGVVDIRGHNAYSCRPEQQEDGTWICEAKPCPYQIQRVRAANAPTYKSIMTTRSSNNSSIINCTSHHNNPPLPQPGLGRRTHCISV